MRSFLVSCAVFGSVLCISAPARAGLYYSGEQIAELPAQWTGFLLDQRALRNIAVLPAAGLAASPMRTRYHQAAEQLVQRSPKLNALESADLGALWIRLGALDKALEVLRRAQRAHPDNFRIIANLGTAWQLQGDLAQAAACLERAAQLAPPSTRGAELLQLRLVRQRKLERPGAQALDDLFSVRYVDEQGNYNPGRISQSERHRLPAEAVALVQQLALWLPADGRLLWQLAELANVQGDAKIAAGIMDGCVSEFGIRDPELRQRRQMTRAAAERLTTAADTGFRATHTEHVSGFRPRSKRALLVKMEEASLPPIQENGATPLLWAVLADTSLDRRYRPTFPAYLHKLDGREVSIQGFLQPLGEDVDLNSFLLIENPVGCWYCEMPEMTGMIQVQLPSDKQAAFTRKPIKITGKLKLNGIDPENFLYTISNAEVAPAE
jgi:tetratricopeptide (TPR) repeat protein